MTSSDSVVACDVDVLATGESVISADTGEEGIPIVDGTKINQNLVIIKISISQRIALSVIIMLVKRLTNDKPEHA